MTPTLLNPLGVFPDVAIPADGRPVVAFRISGSNLLRVMFLEVDGQPTGTQEDIDCAMGDSTFARLIVALGSTWLAYRAFRGGLEQAVVRQVLPFSLGPERVLGPTFGNNPVCLSAAGLVAWQDPTAGVVRGLRLSDGETLILRFEMRPTGLSHLDWDQPVFADDNRPTEPAMWNPVRAGAVTVGEGRGQAEGLVARVEVAPNDIRTGIVLPGSCLNPRCADFGESTYAAVSWTPGVGVQFLKFTPNDIPVAPPVSKPKPIPLAQVEPLVGKWLVSYYEQNGNVPFINLPPGNAMVAVRNQHGPQPRPMILTFETEGKVAGQVIGFRIGSEAQFVGEVVTIEVMEARARVVAAKGYRPWFYWDEPTTPRPPVLPVGSVIEVYGFCGKDESIPDWERDRRHRLREAAAWPGQYLLAISAQTHNTNPALQPEPSVMIPPMMRLCRWARAEFGDRFLGIDIFCNSGRPDPATGKGGLVENPQLVPHWTKVFSGVTGLPSFAVSQTPPVDPPPVDPPIDPPVPPVDPPTPPIDPPIEPPVEPPIDPPPPPPPGRVRPYDDGSCATVRPGTDWTCDKGSWYPPNMPIPIGPPPPPPVDPPVPPVEPPMMQPPKITISEPTFPISGTAPLKVRCVYATEPGSGPVAFIEWWHRGSDHVTRTIVNPGADPDHTFTFPTAGTYEIGAVGVNAAGRHPTGRKREVVVTAVHVPPQEPPVTEPTPEKGFTLRTDHGNFITVKNGVLAAGADPAQFKVERVGTDKIAFIVVQPPMPHPYVRAVDGGGGELRVDRDTAGPDEAFTVHTVVASSGAFALQTRTGKFVSAEKTGRVIANRVITDLTTLGGWEILTPSFAPFGSGGGGPIPPSSGDLTSWPRRGASLYALVTDGAWDYDRFSEQLHECGMNLTRVFALTANWAEQVNDIVWPFRKLADGRWDLFDWNQKYFDRLERVIGALNSQGVLVQLTLTELYGWSDRKRGLPGVPDAEQGPWRRNVNGIRWDSDLMFDVLPDDWLNQFIDRVVQTTKGAGVVYELGNEMPEKPFHFRLRDAIRRTWPEALVTVNRQEDTPGQYANMGIGRDFDRIAYHGKRDLASLDEVHDNGAATDRPDTIRKLIDGWPGVDPKRIIFSSDGCRASMDPVNTYDWPTLLEVIRYVVGKGCSYEHQSRAKIRRILTGQADLNAVEADFLKQIANL